MPLVIFIPYFFIEALAFWGVSEWLGVGWALFALFAFMAGGVVLAAWEMRQISVKLATGGRSPGASAGDLGLVAAGAMLVALPGFVTSIFGLLLIIAPTRSLIRKMMAKRMRSWLEDMGVRSYNATNQYRHHAQYGSFTPKSDDDPGFDENQIQIWTRDVKPEDFGSPGQKGS